MAQYEVPPATLAPYLPAGTELDLFEGRSYVSLVGFLFDRVRLKGIPIPTYRRFEEVNLRFYVRRTEPDGRSKRGVVFIRELVPKLAITLVAQTIYEEPYATVPMRHRIRRAAGRWNVSYDWKFKGAWYSMAVEADANAVAIRPGTVEDFITEHYWGYTKRSRGTTSEYEVRHPSWVTYPVERYKIDVDFGALYGADFASLNGDEPSSILLAEGSAVSVNSGARLPE